MSQHSQHRARLDLQPPTMIVVCAMLDGTEAQAVGPWVACDAAERWTAHGAAMRIGGTVSELGT
jgi:hypothetical protein